MFVAFDDCIISIMFSHRWKSHYIQYLKEKKKKNNYNVRSAFTCRSIYCRYLIDIWSECVSNFCIVFFLFSFSNLKYNMRLRMCLEIDYFCNCFKRPISRDKEQSTERSIMKRFVNRKAQRMKNKNSRERAKEKERKVKE